MADGRPSDVPKADEELIDLFRKGDRGAFEAIYKLYKDRLYTYAIGIVGRTAWAEDIIQEAMARLVEKPGALRENGALRRFLYACVHNSAIDHLRRGKNGHKPLPDDEVLEAPESGGLDEEDRRRVQRSMRRLSPDQREIVFLKAYEDMTLVEIASILGKPQGTVFAQYHRAIAHLRAELEPIQEKESSQSQDSKGPNYAPGGGPWERWREELP